jgi:hypothetical protein
MVGTLSTQPCLKAEVSPAPRPANLRQHPSLLAAPAFPARILKMTDLCLVGQSTIVSGKLIACHNRGALLGIVCYNKSDSLEQHFFNAGNRDQLRTKTNTGSNGVKTSSSLSGIVRRKTVALEEAQSLCALPFSTTRRQPPRPIHHLYQQLLSPDRHPAQTSESDGSYALLDATNQDSPESIDCCGLRRRTPTRLSAPTHPGLTTTYHHVGVLPAAHCVELS